MNTVTTRKLIKDNFDINVYNRGADESTVLPPEQYYDEWVLCPYSLEWDGDDIVIGQELSQFNLVLTDQDVLDLTLGYGDGDLIGDHCADNDFWIDSNSFRETYKHIPIKVKVWLDFVEANL
jgi:hypothetical protein